MNSSLTYMATIYNTKVKNENNHKDHKAHGLKYFIIFKIGKCSLQAGYTVFIDVKLKKWKI